MNAVPKALVVEDDDDLQGLMRVVLGAAGFEVHAASSGVEALAAAQEIDPDLITLDLNLPDTDGLILCRGIRNVTDAYIIILTARSDRAQLLVGLESGADDYMTKPFSTKELTARVKALLRRPRNLGSPPVPAAALSHGDLVMVISNRTADLAGVELTLTKVEYDVLAALAVRPEQLVTRQQLLEQVWGDRLGDSHLVDVHVANLRRKLRAVGGEVEVLTVRGLGYRLHQRSSSASTLTDS